LLKKLSFRKLQIITFSVIAVILLLLFLPNIVVWITTKSKSTDQIDKVEPADVALVLGTSPKIGTRDNSYFTHRIDAAEELYKSGKVKCFLLSGANPSVYYNEPKDMKAALVERGIPADIIVLDYAGLRTLDSVVRAKEIFDAKDVIIVSQAFHNHRALFIANHIDLPATAYEAKDIGSKIKIREIGARIKVFLDLFITNKKPKHMGEKEQLPIFLSTSKNK